MSDTPGQPRVVFRCDASSQIGGGHVMRCLTLANALSEGGAKVTFVAAAMPEALERRVAAAGHRVERIPASPEMQREGAAWEEPSLTAEAQVADAKATAAIGKADWIVVDHYLLDAHWRSAARGFSGHVLVIDDLANRTYDCDILVDQTFGRSAGDYRDLVPDGCRILAGSQYALLRPEFARERPAALERRKAGGRPHRILVSMGAMDPEGITVRIVEEVLAVAPECTMDVVLGPQAASLEQLREIIRRSRVALHVDTDRMAELMRDADIAVGAAGTTSWERCCLGLPSVAVAVAKNQAPPAAILERAGAVLLAESVDAIPSFLEGLLNDEQKLLSMSAAAAAITDGHGAEVVADVMMGGTPNCEVQLALRPAGPQDCSIVWLWRNDFITRSFSQEAAPIAWPDHQAWWQRADKANGRQLMIAEVANAPVAALRFDQLGDEGFEVSINLAPSARGSRLGGRILAEACSAFLEQHGRVPLIATIHRDNVASRRIFEKLGFVRTGNLSNSAFDRYVRAREASP